MKHNWKAQELVLEIDAENAMVQFTPLAQRLRGSWSARYAPSQSRKARYHQMPDVPGQMIVLNAKERYLKIVDPLGFQTEEMSRLLDEINAIKESWQGKSGAHPTQVHKDLTDTQIKTFLWYMHQIHETGRGKLHNGRMPNARTILSMPGKLQTKFYSSMQDDRKYATDEEIESMGGPPAVVAESS